MTTVKDVSLSDALIPIISLIVLLALSVSLFGDGSSAGPNQIVLITCAAIACGIAVRNGHRWDDLQTAMVDGISTAMGAIMILLAVGALIGTWMMAGTVPSMIYYGLKLMNPQYFFATTCLICAITSVSIGSSWTVAGTLGVGLIGVSMGLGISPAITAGAIVSGAYFGDKMSPLSDTTNLAAAVVETDLFDHIRHMAWTTGPSFIIALLIFTVIGIGSEVSSDGETLAITMNALSQSYNITLLTLIPLGVVLFLAMRRVPPLPTILFGALLGGLTAIALQPEVVLEFADSPETGAILGYTKGVWLALADGFVSSTGNAEVDNLLSRGGMSSMLTTIWLIISALAFGAVLEYAGMLGRLIKSALNAAKSTGALIATVVGSCIGVNIVAGEQYMAVVLPGKMFKAEFARRKLDSRNLSRTIEDAGTLTSPLVPWNTCGAYMAATLGVATFAYLPFAFFNLINPLVAIYYGYTGITIKHLDEDELASAYGAITNSDR